MNVSVADTTLAARVEHALGEDPEVSICDLRVDVVDGVVHLSGVSATLAGVRRAEELAAQIPEDGEVDNLLSVESPQSRTDGELREQARAAAASVDARVDVEVEDGIAVLRGEVERPELLDEVIRAVERVPGLRELRSEVTFTSLTAYEQQVRPLLEEALRASHPAPGAVRVAGLREGLVTLEGGVSSSEQRDRVLESVRKVPGVRRVQSRIRIRPNRPEGGAGAGMSSEQALLAPARSGRRSCTSGATPADEVLDGPPPTCPVFRVEGERIDARTAWDLRPALLRALYREGSDLWLDLSRVRFIDSSGLGMLISVLKEARKMGGNVHLMYAGRDVQRILQVTGLECLFDANPGGGGPGAAP